MSDMSVGEIILQQLGGPGVLKTMTGGHNLYTVPKGLIFSIGPFPDVKVRRIEILLNGSDLYDVHFLDAQCREIHNAKDVFVEDLRGVLEETTGLSFRVPRVQVKSGMSL
jgi:hypothetical protein